MYYRMWKATFAVFFFFATDLKAVSETPFCDHSIGKQ